MASLRSSLLLHLTRNWRIASAEASGRRTRLLSTGTDAAKEEEDPGFGDRNDDDLRSRIMRLRLPKRSAFNVIQRWVGEGNSVSGPELRLIAKELRKSQRYKHALEILEWMVTHEEFELSESDFASRIELMGKVFGIDAADRYFEGLPLTAKTCETYTALLHSFAAAKHVERAEGLYRRMKGSNLSFTALAYNEMMTMYMSVGHVEKVSFVIEDMKCLKVAPDLFTYNLWISSCAATLQIDQVKRILEEMSSDSGFNDDWGRYINTVNAYVTAGQLFNTEVGSVVVAEKSMTQREWITYDFVVMLHVGLGNKDKIDQIWKALRMTKQKMTNRNYICILSSYLMLGSLKEVGDIIDEWKLSATSEFDPSACSRLLDSLSSAGLTDVANNFHMLLIERDFDPSKASH